MTGCALELYALNQSIASIALPKTPADNTRALTSRSLRLRSLTPSPVACVKVLASGRIAIENINIVYHYIITGDIIQERFS